MTDRMKFTLPLMMYGINGFEWHRKGEPVLHRPIIGEDTIKSGTNKGKARKVRSKEWLLKTRKRKTLIGYDEANPYKSGKNKGKPRKQFEDKFFPIESTGYFPTVNHIYMQIGGGASRRLKPIAEEKLLEWKEIALVEAKEVGYVSMDKPQFVVVDLEFYLPRNGAGDTHNAKKLLLDALEGVVHNDDFYMLDRTNKVRFDDENPRIEVSVLAYEGRT